MAQPNRCYGHKERKNRTSLISQSGTRPKKTLDESCRVFIKKGPVAVETSLKELEESYKKKPEWKVIEGGGVLNIPVEELRMQNPPRPDRSSGQVLFKEKKGGGGKQIENYPVGQTIDNLNSLIRDKYEEEKEKAKAAGEL